MFQHVTWCINRMYCVYITYTVRVGCASYVLHHYKYSVYMSCVYSIKLYMVYYMRYIWRPPFGHIANPQPKQ